MAYKTINHIHDIYTNNSEFQHHSQTKHTNNLIYCTLHLEQQNMEFHSQKSLKFKCNSPHGVPNSPGFFRSKGEGWHNNHHAFETSCRHGLCLVLPNLFKGWEITEFVSEIQWRIFWIVGNFGLEWYHWYLVFVAFFCIFHRNWRIWNDRKTNLFDWWAQYWIQCRCCHVGSPFVGQSMCCCPDEIYLASWEQNETNPTPWKIKMEPTNHPFRKENDLPNLHYYVPC